MIEDVDVKGAVRVSSSDNTLASFDDSSRHLVQEKHPSARSDLNFPFPSDDNDEPG